MNDGAAKAGDVEHAARSGGALEGAPDAGLAIWTTRRTSGRSSRTRRAISSVVTSLVSTQTTACALSRPASVSPSPRWAPVDRGTPLILDDPGQTKVGVVVHDHDGNAAQVKLFDCSQAHAA